LIAAEAVEWFVCLQGSSPMPDERARFAAWLRASSEHVAEYLAVSEAWGDSRLVLDEYPQAAELREEAQCEGNPDNVVPLTSAELFSVRVVTPALAASESQSRQPRWPGRRLAFACASVFIAVVAGATLWLSRGIFLESSLERHYVTGNKEHLTVSLEDGSVVHLNANSEAYIIYGTHARRVKLDEGEARFHVASDAHRPFTVITERATVRALGTVFDIYRRNDDTKVTVVEGRVEVHSNRGGRGLVPASSASQLGPGEEIAVLVTGQLLKIPAPDLARVLAWPEQRLAFHSKPLTEVIDEFNRYNSPAMKIEDPELARLEVSGAFQADDPQSLLLYLERHESVVVTSGTDGVIVLKRRGTPGS